MGLAERFKDKLDKRDIFKKNTIEKTLLEQKIEFISKPLDEQSKDEDIQQEIVTETTTDTNTTVTENYEQKQDSLQSANFQIEPLTNILEITPEENTPVIEIIGEKNSDTKFEDLETEIINKIRKTPYWEDFSRKQQENMISKYFDVKIQKGKYIKIEYSTKDKFDFIQNILALSNNR